MELQKTASRKWLLVVLLYAVIFLQGCVGAVRSTDVLYMPVCYLLASVAVQWAVLDAKEKGNPIPYAVQLIMFLSWPIAMPAYLIYSRGLKGFGWSVLHLLGLGVSLYLGFYGAFYLMH